MHPRSRPSILIVNADNNFSLSVGRALDAAGCVDAHSTTFADAIGRLDGFAYDGLIVDLEIPGGDGLEVLDTALARYPGMRCVVTASSGCIHQAVRALKRGAIDYFIKPAPAADIVDALMKSAPRRIEERASVEPADSASPSRSRFPGIVGGGPAMAQLFRTLERVAPMQSTVLIQGETGTGKELIARTIHENSTRAEHPFVAFNAAAIPEGLAEAELFGHVKGAFTGAVQSRIGRFEAADRGTLFIDEVSSISLTLQAKLLRALQEREVERVGTSRPVKINVRVIAASNEDLAELVREGRFREDLYYRLNVVRVSLPTLRARTEDIPQLAQHFVDASCRTNGLAPKVLSQAALQALMAYNWPGNVRQLQNAVETAVVMSGADREIGADVMPEEVLHRKTTVMATRGAGVALPPTPDEGINFVSAMSQIERELILTYLQKAGGNKRQAARLLSLSRTTLIDKLHRLGVRDIVTGGDVAAAVA